MHQRLIAQRIGSGRTAKVKVGLTCGQMVGSARLWWILDA